MSYRLYGRPLFPSLRPLAESSCVLVSSCQRVNVSTLTWLLTRPKMGRKMADSASLPRITLRDAYFKDLEEGYEQDITRVGG